MLTSCGRIPRNPETPSFQSKRFLLESEILRITQNTFPPAFTVAFDTVDERNTFPCSVLRRIGHFSVLHTSGRVVSFAGKQ